MLAAAICASGCAHRAPTLDPPSFVDGELGCALRLDDRLIVHLTNRTDEELTVRWDELTLVGPDHREVALHVSASEPLAPHGEIDVAVSPFALRGKSVGREAPFELVVPTVVRGAERVYHFHVRLRRA